MFDFIFFRRMLTPVLIQIVFWAAVIFFIISGFIDMFGEQGVWNGIKILILGPITARIICETLILFFQINASLTDIRNVMADPSYFIKREGR